MTDGYRVLLAAFIGCALMGGASGALIAIAGEWASDDMRIGHGSSRFPPQAVSDAETRRTHP